MLDNLFDANAVAELDRQFADVTRRDAFRIPQHDGADMAYFVGNSLGLQPVRAADTVNEILGKWADLGVDGHFTGETQWLTYHRLVRDGVARLVGAEPSEVVAMNTLTVNLHLLMASFFKPTNERRAILIEKGAFPTDSYVVQSQLEFHGLDPVHDLIEVEPAADGWFSDEVIRNAIADNADRLALVLWPGVQYRSGQVFDLKAIAAWAHEAGAMVGFDCAHSIGNVPMNLHDADADFAVWCHYKYVNSGPGAVAGAFVHSKHGNGSDRPRLAGWWGNRQDTRFKMASHFEPAQGAEAWQLSNPPVLAMAPLRASLELFDSVPAERRYAYARSMTDYLFALVDRHFADTIEAVTPREPERRGCQVSLRIRADRDKGRELFSFLESRGVLGDWREPDVIRIAPVPLYNTHQDVLRLANTLTEWCNG